MEHLVGCDLIRFALSLRLSLVLFDSLPAPPLPPVPLSLFLPPSSLPSPPAPLLPSPCLTCYENHAADGEAKVSNPRTPVDQSESEAGKNSHSKVGRTLDDQSTTTRSTDKHN